MHVWEFAERRHDRSCMGEPEDGAKDYKERRTNSSLANAFCIFTDAPSLRLFVNTFSRATNQSHQNDRIPPRWLLHIPKANASSVGQSSMVVIAKTTRQTTPKISLVICWWSMSGMSSQTTDRNNAIPPRDMGTRDRATELSEGAGGTLTTVAGPS